jgi:hypothetical protein
VVYSNIRMISILDQNYGIGQMCWYDHLLHHNLVVILSWIYFLGSMAKERWGNLRSTFQSNQKRVFPKSGASTDESNARQPTWPLYLRLMFLAPCVKTSKSQCNMPPNVSCMAKYCLLTIMLAVVGTMIFWKKVWFELFPSTYLHRHVVGTYCRL